jgi:hypothetical protein
MTGLDYDLLHPSRPYENAYLRLEADHLLDMQQRDPGGRLLLVTNTFPGRRFASLSWSCADARRVIGMLERASDDLFHAFRGFYVALLVAAVDDFRHCNDLQPTVVAFLDDRQQGELERFPHLHSVWFVPSPVVEAVTAWLASTDAAKTWANLSGGGGLHVEAVDPEAMSLRRTVAYAGKLLTAAEARDAPPAALMRVFPDRPAQEAEGRPQRPPQARDGAASGARRGACRRRHRAADHRRTARVEVVRLPSRWAA